MRWVEREISLELIPRQEKHKSLSKSHSHAFILMRALIQSANNACKYLHLNVCVYVRYLIMKRIYNSFLNYNKFLF